MRKAWLRGQYLARSCIARLRHGTAHIAATLLDSFAILTGFYYSTKYAAIVRRLGLRADASSPDQPGFVFIQIDGLSHDLLQRALAKGRVPHLSHMLSREGCRLASWNCGLPSSTPASQAGIMFGDNEDIPAFRWYDKQRGVSIVCQVPRVLAQLQNRISRNRPGILTGGASYANLFSGGASTSLFTLSDLHPRHFFEQVRGIGFVVLFLLNPLRTLRMLYLVLQEHITDALQRFRSRLKGEPRASLLRPLPLLRVANNVLLREIATFAVLVDIYRGVPAIYVSYYGYDELAHHFGADSMATRQALGDIDHRIGQIQRLARLNLSRPYAVVVLSDHGETPSQPFSHLFGCSLGEHISQQIGRSVRLVEHAGGDERSREEARFLLEEMRHIEKHMRPTAARVARRARILLRRRLANRPEGMPEWDLSRQFDVMVKCSGSMAHVYFNLAPRRLDLSEVSAAFPGLVTELRNHSGIWMAVAQEGQQTLVMSRDGILALGNGPGEQVEGTNPLSHLAQPEVAARQIRRLASFPTCGDLVLFGAYDQARDLVVSFEEQWASHGGLGGPQDRPFIIYPERFAWDLSRVHNAADLYPLLAEQRGLKRSS